MNARAYIYTGGAIYADLIKEHPCDGDTVIAADSGYKNALLHGAKVNILVGDMDSLGQKFDFEKIPKDTEIIRVPAEKDDTDTMLAVKIALERGFSDLTVIGGLGGRIDHLLSNLYILEFLRTSFDGKRINAVITDGHNRAVFIKDEELTVPRSDYKYISLISADEVCEGVCIHGCKYPLENARIIRTCQYAVSNEIVGTAAEIKVARGGMFVIESRD